MAFIFDAMKGETPGSLARQREIAEALAGNAMGRAPRDIGEGLNIRTSLVSRWKVDDEKSPNRNAPGRRSARRTHAHATHC
jgi:hypothetical protein